MWLASPTATRTSLQTSLLDLINTVEEQHGSTGLDDQRLGALQTLDPLIEAEAARPGVAWSTLAATLLAMRPGVVPAEAVALPASPSRISSPTAWPSPPPRGPSPDPKASTD